MRWRCLRAAPAQLLQPPDEAAPRWIVRVRAICAPLVAAAAAHGGKAGAAPARLAPSVSQAEVIGQWYYRAADTATAGPPEVAALGPRAEAEARAALRERVEAEARLQREEEEEDERERTSDDDNEEEEEGASAARSSPPAPARRGRGRPRGRARLTGRAASTRPAAPAVVPAVPEPKTGAEPPAADGAAAQEREAAGAEAAAAEARSPPLLAHSLEAMSQPLPLPLPTRPLAARPLPAPEAAQLRSSAPRLESVYLFGGQCESQPLASVVGTCRVFELPTQSERVVSAAGGEGAASAGAPAEAASAAEHASAQPPRPAGDQPSFVCRMQYEPGGNRFLPLRAPDEAGAGRVGTARDCWELLLQLEAAVDWAHVWPEWQQRRLQWIHGALLAGTPAKLARALTELSGALRPAATDSWAAACESGAWDAAVRAAAKSAAALAEVAVQLRTVCVRPDALLAPSVGLT